MSQAEGSQSYINDYNSKVNPEYSVSGTASTQYWCAGIRSRVEKIRPFFTGQSETQELISGPLIHYL